MNAVFKVDAEGGRRERHETPRHRRTGLFGRLPGNAGGTGDPGPRAVRRLRRGGVRGAGMPQRARTRHGHAGGDGPAGTIGLDLSVRLTYIYVSIHKVE